MHLRLVEPAARSRATRPDPWLTVSAWMWTGYLTAVGGALVWWVT